MAADGKCAAGSPEDFRALLEDAAVVKVGAGLKSQMNALADAGVELRGRLEDVELMHYLLNPESSHSLGRLAMGYLGVALDDAGPAEPAGLFDDAPAEDESGALRETAVLLPLADRLNAEIDRTEGMRRLYDEIEEPLLSVLSRMERTGVKVDLDSLRDYAAGLRREMLEKEAAVREIAGDPQFNVSSPRQIGALVYEKLKLAPKAKKPKSGNWPTDERTLLELGSDSPVIHLSARRQGAHHLQPDADLHRQAFVFEPQPAEHPHTHRPGPGDTPRLRGRKPRERDDVGRLLPDRTAHHGAPEPGRASGGGLPRRA